jgi:membrane protein implicated in regulation of membrane protease activity
MLDFIFLIAAVIGGTVVFCQLVMALVGLGHDFVDVGGHVGDVGTDFHGDMHTGDAIHGHDTADVHHADSSWLFAVVSFRSVVAALAFFGLGGLAARSAGYPAATSLVVATICGFFAMYGVYRFLRLVSRLDSSGNERIGNALGRPATVYIPIPAGGKGAGKVQLSMQNRIVEYQAVTDDAEPLKTGESVEVIGIAGTDILRVRRAAQPIEA